MSPHVVALFFDTRDLPSPLAMMILSAADPEARFASSRRWLETATQAIVDEGADRERSRAWRPSRHASQRLGRR